MTMRANKMTLAGLLDGAVQEQFEEAVRQLAANIDDPNTKAEAKRSITIELQVQPTETRQAATLAAQVKVKLAPPRATKGTLFIAHEEGDYVVREFNPNQGTLDFNAGGHSEEIETAG